HCHWWVHRTGLERALALACALLLAVVAALLIIHLSSSEQPRWEVASPTSACFSQECIRAAATIMERAQLFRDPCVDFDAFACGRFVRDHSAPDDHYFTNTLISMQDAIFVRLKKLLEETNVSNRSSAVSKVKTLYNSCMNTSSVEDGSVTLLRDLLRDEGGMGAWPALQQSESLSLQSLELERRLAVLRVHGVEPFFQLHVGQDEKNSSMHVVQIFSSSPVLRSEYYLNDTDDRCREALRLYKNTMAQAARLLGAKQPERDIDDVIEFEVQFANISHMGDYEGAGGSGASNTSGESPSYDSAMVSVTLAELHEMAPEANIIILSTFLTPLPCRSHLESQDKNYLPAFAGDINVKTTLSMSNLRCGYSVMLDCDPIWDVDVGRAQEELQISPCAGPASRRYCIRSRAQAFRSRMALKKAASLPVFALITIHIYFPLTRLSSLCSNFHVTLLLAHVMEHSYVEIWVGDQTEICACDLATSRGRPFLAGFCTKYLCNYIGTRDLFSEIIIPCCLFRGAIAFLFTKHTTHLRGPWQHHHVTYMRVPAWRHDYVAYLRAPAKPSERTGSLNEARSAYCAHRLFCAGKKFDKHGNFSNWWPDDALEQLRQRAGCFVDQFSQFPLKEPGVYVNGNTTLEENICDSTAVKLAYRAYQLWTSKHGEEPRLPGLGLSNDQVFFVQYAQIWCEVVDEEGYKKYQSESHSPGKYRSNGALQNFDEFARAFHCPLGSPMNPEKKCSLWD
ncbi:unnamed protein product, partial [Ixodes hexagonus]